MNPYPNTPEEGEEPQCGVCWRMTLTEEQRQDPANRPTGTGHVCDKHKAVMGGIVKTFFAVMDHGHFSPQSQAAAEETTQALRDLRSGEARE